MANISEGGRRIFLIVAWIASISGLVAVLKHFPTDADHYAFWANTARINLDLHVERNPWTRYQNLKPEAATDEEFIKKLCMRPYSPEATESCKLFKSDNESLRKRQLEAVAAGFGIAALFFFVVRLVWFGIDWVIRGFQRPQA
jgi:hypothetical protein